MGLSGFNFPLNQSMNEADASVFAEADPVIAGWSFWETIDGKKTSQPVANWKSVFNCFVVNIPSLNGFTLGLFLLKTIVCYTCKRCFFLGMLTIYRWFPRHRNGPTALPSSTALHSARDAMGKLCNQQLFCNLRLLKKLGFSKNDWAWGIIRNTPFIKDLNKVTEW